MGVFEDELLLVQRGGGAVAVVLPSGNVGEVHVVALGLAGLSAAADDFGTVIEELVLHPEMATAGFFAVAGVVAHDFAEFEEVGDAAGFF